MDVKITEDELVQEREVSRSLLKRYRMPQFFATVESGPYGFTRTHLEVLESLETALSVLQEACKWLRHQLEGVHAPRQDADRFIHLYAMFVACAILSELLPQTDGTRVQVEGKFRSDDIRRIAEFDDETLPDAILGDYLQYLEFYRTHPQADKRLTSNERLLTCTRAYFALLQNSCQNIGSDALYAPLLQALKRGPLEILGRRFDGFQWHQASAEEVNDLLPVALDDIVGNEEFVKAGTRLARDVAGFDLEARQNPKKLNPVLFAMGDPGCGKTVTCHAIGHYFLEYCKARNIPARFLIIRRSDWASSYQNASAANLIDIFKNKVAGFNGVVGVYWPDIDTAFAAREDPGVRSEEKNILGAVFGIFDGTILPKNGQWFMLTDANTLNLDRAAVSRITQDPYHLKGPIDAADFVTLLRDKKMAAHKPFLHLSEDEWSRIGEKCVALKLSGRSIENITRKLVTEIEDFEYPDDYFKADLQRRKAIIQERSRPIDFTHLSNLIDRYYRFEKEAEERAYRERFESRVKEIVFNLTAQAAAVDAHHSTS